MDPSSVPPASGSPPWDVFPQQTLEPVDIAVLVLYFLFVLAVGLWVSRTSNTSCGVLKKGLEWGCFPLHSAEQGAGSSQLLVLSSAWEVSSLSPGSAQARVSQGFENPCEEEAG